MSSGDVGVKGHSLTFGLLWSSREVLDEGLKWAEHRWNAGSHRYINGARPAAYTVRGRWAHPFSAFTSLFSLLDALCMLYETELP